MANGAVLNQSVTVSDSFPIGGIIIWSGSESNIPENWVLCNGSNGTPDLRGKFVLGCSSTYAVGTTGGEETHTLTVSEMPSHTHSFSTKLSTSGESASGGGAGLATYDKIKELTINSTGGSQAHNNMPPYYALCYIMKIA